MEIDKKQLATIIATIRDKSKYTVIEQGFFRKVPSIQGYLYELPRFKTLDKYHLVLIVNTNTKVPFPREQSVNKNYTFLIFNSDSFENFAKNATIVASKLSGEIEEIATKVEEEQDGDLPYGYKRDENGEVQIDLKKASEVKDIYNMYVETRSMKQIAKELNSNFSHVRDVLRDERYDDMNPRIVSPSVWKRVEEISHENQKNTTTRADNSLMGEIKKEIKSKVKGIK